MILDAARVRRALSRRFGAKDKAEVLFLHIGKTGGTALRQVLEADAARVGSERLRQLGHENTLRSVLKRHPSSQVAWFVRDPADRFVSGYFSRQRQGRPRYDNPWSAEEARVFNDFPTVGALIEGIGAKDPSARRAVRVVLHMARGLAHVLDSPSFLSANANSISFIGVTEQLPQEVERLKRRFRIDGGIFAPSDTVNAHRNPNPAEAKLSEEERRILKAYLATDYAVYDWCLAHRAKMMASA